MLEAVAVGHRKTVSGAVPEGNPNAAAGAGPEDNLKTPAGAVLEGNLMADLAELEHYQLGWEVHNSLCAEDSWEDNEQEVRDNRSVVGRGRSRKRSMEDMPVGWRPLDSQIGRDQRQYWRASRQVHQSKSADVGRLQILGSLARLVLQGWSEDSLHCSQVGSLRCYLAHSLQDIHQSCSQDMVLYSREIASKDGLWSRQ